MKKTVTYCIIVMLLVSCQKSAVSPSSDKQAAQLTTRNLGSFNGALTFRDQQDVDISSLGLLVSSCTGEPLQVVSGIYHLDVHGTVNGNSLAIVQHENAQNFKLVGLGTGAEYTGSSTLNESTNLSMVNGKFIFTGTATILMTTPGGKNNSIIRFDVHETFNAQGAMTAFIDNLSLGCK